jgi:CRISPR-associated protein Csm4
MTLYKITIKPISNFSSSIKGDTLFGQLCWAISFTFSQDRLKELLKTYDTKPFLIVSDAFANGYLPKPSLPSLLLNEKSEDKKKNRKEIWLTLKQLENGEFNQAQTDKKVGNKDRSATVVRNSINYLTSTTGNGFDPYGTKEIDLKEKDIFFLIDLKQFSLEEFKKSFDTLSKLGYGADTSIGKGRFEYGHMMKINLSFTSTTFMSLSPFSPQHIECKNIYYEPFTRFGKTGYQRATTNAFKKPILLADSGGVIVFEQKQSLQYIGKAIKQISTYKDIVHQGYSIVVAMKGLDNENI